MRFKSKLCNVTSAGPSDAKYLVKYLCLKLYGNVKISCGLIKKFVSEQHT